ncbi:MAG: 2OG-Fe(II) oxygenase [Pseudomonadota bacterium]
MNEGVLDLGEALDAQGWALTGPLLSSHECAALRDAFDDRARFRSHIDMQRHGYGRGEYRYFNYPLPAVVQQLRETLYARLVPLANQWQVRLGHSQRFPASLDEYLERCHRAGQCRPTPLVLRYAAGDYNRLHQDLYGDQVFPLQLAVLLGNPGEDFEGGEFVLTEQKARSQSRVDVVPLAGAGDGVVFAVNERPARGPRGDHRVRMRHGVSCVRRGERMTLGVIFHDAS